VSFAAGPFGYWSLSTARGGLLRVEAYLDTGRADENKAIFDTLVPFRETLQVSVGEEVSFERLDERRASRIAVYRPVDLDDPVARESARRWAIDRLLLLHAELDSRLREVATEVRRERLALG
jgi:hypothetical protein